MEVNEKYYGVLFDYVFGKSKEDLTIEDIALGGAYRDMASHTLIRKNVNGWTDKVWEVKKNTWKKETAKLMSKQIEILDENSDFNKWHSETCLAMISKTQKLLKDEVILSYGQAQKWLNMTLKNMLITGKWEEKFKGVKEFLHCPVDSFIINAAEDLGIAVPKKSGKPSENKPWSKWGLDENENALANPSEEYIAFQDALRKALGKLSPINWEIAIWPIYKSEGFERKSKNQWEKSKDNRLQKLKKALKQENKTLAIYNENDKENL